MRRRQLLHLLLCLSILSVYLPSPQGTPTNSVPVAHAQTAAKQVDIVFVVDTSGSMDEEFTTLCDTIDVLVSDLEAKSIEVRSRILGITEPRACFSEFVSAVIPGAISDHPEDWGPAVRDIAAGYTWLPGYTRLVIPMSDEAPEDGGDNPEGMPGICEDPGSDRDAITVAINAAQANSVRVAPVLGIGMGQCTITLAQDLADATGGQVFFTTTPRDDLADGIASLIEAVAEDSDGDGIPDDEDPFPDDPCRPDPQAICLPPQVCGKTNTPHWDDDKDGQTDEELQNGLDEDGDGLIDEDVGGVNCPYPDQDCGVNSHRGFDDDADGRIDEEADDGVDNDGDHFIDEDVACPCPPEQDLGINDTPGVDDDHDFQKDEEADDGLDNDGDGCIDEDVGAAPPPPPDILVVEILTPIGTERYFYGDYPLVAARVRLGGQHVAGAQVTGEVSLPGGPGVLAFDLPDTGGFGDSIPDDGIYSARIALLGPQYMPIGNYTLRVEARFVEPDGTVRVGEATTIFTIAGKSDGAPEVELMVQGPNTPEVLVGDTVTFSLVATFPDMASYNDSVATVTVWRPDQRQEQVTLANAGDNHWQGQYTFSHGGRYLLDARLTPPPATFFVNGYASTIVDVFWSPVPLTITPIGLPATFLSNSPVVLEVAVEADGQAVDGATVSAVVNPGDERLVLMSVGGGRYYAILMPETPATFTVDLIASVPFYKDGSASVQFTVEQQNALLQDAIGQFVTANNHHLQRVDKNAEQVMIDGDYFRKKISSDRIGMVINIGLDLFSLAKVGGAFKGFFKATDKFKGFVSSHIPGLKHLRAIQGTGGADGRVWKAWATRLQHGMQKKLMQPGSEATAHYVGLGVMKRAAVYLAAKVGEKSIDEITEEKISQIFSNGLATNPDFLHEELYPEVQATIAEDQKVLTDYGAFVKDNLPEIDDIQESALIRDLFSRSRANGSLASDTYWHNAELFESAEARRAEDGWLSIIAKAIISAAVDVAVGFFFDGPGLVVLYATKVGFHYLEGMKDISEDERMSNLAFNGLKPLLEVEEQIFTNCIGGLVQIRNDETPSVPTGEVLGIQDISRGSEGFFGLFFSEKEAFARVQIKNTGHERAQFGLRANYRQKGGWQSKSHYYWQEAVKDTSTGEFEHWVPLDPGQTKTVVIQYKGKGGKDMRPDDNGTISYVLLASTESGLYFADSRVDRFDPQRELVSLSPQEVPASSQLASAQKYMVAPHPASHRIPNPISAMVRTGPETLSYQILLQAQNPFPFPIAATVSQALPAEVTVVSSDGGVVENRTISWQRVILPHTDHTFSYNVVVAGAPESQVQIPAAELSFYSAEHNDTAVFVDFPLTLRTKIPLVATADEPLPPAEMLTVEVSNLASTEESGELLLTLFDLNENEVGRTTSEVTVPAMSGQKVELPLPTGLKPDTLYIYSALLVYEGLESDILWASYQTPPSVATPSPGVFVPVSPPRQPMTWLFLVLAAGGLLVGAVAIYLYSQRPPVPSPPPVPPPAPASLQLRRGQAQPQRVNLRGTVTTIGRGRDNHVTVEDSLVSRRHCQIRRQGGGFILEDLGSTNGTFLNGQRVTRKRLHSNDVVGVGQTELVFRQLSVGQPRPR